MDRLQLQSTRCRLKLRSADTSCLASTSPPQASDRWIGTLNLLFSKQATPAPAHGGQQARPVGAPTRLLPLPFLGGTFNSTYNVQQPVFKFVTPRRLKRAVITSVITGRWNGWPALCCEAVERATPGGPQGGE